METNDINFISQISIGENPIDKLTYSNNRFNKCFLMPSEPAAIFFVGPRGTGKTTKMLGMLPYLDYDTLAVFSTTLGQPKISALRIQKQQMEEQYDISLDDKMLFSDDLSIVIDGSYIKSREPGKHHIVIIDDFASLPLKEQEKAFRMLIMNGRPLGITSLLSTQAFYAIDKKLRDNATHFALFKNIIPGDIKRIAKDYIPDIKPEDFLTMYNHIMNNKEVFGDKPFMYYDKMTNYNELRIRGNFDKLHVTARVSPPCPHN